MANEYRGLTTCSRCGLIVELALGGRGIDGKIVCDTCFEAAVFRGEIELYMPSDEEVEREALAAEAYIQGYEDGERYAKMRSKYLYPNDTCTAPEHLCYIAGFHDGHFSRPFEPAGAEDRDVSALPAAAFSS